MEILRTPDRCFDNLPGFPYEPRYLTLGGLRIHYIDHGVGKVVLCLHGEPTWSYLYRSVIATLSSQFRVVAMDFLGFGRSDKPAEVADHSLELHRSTLIAFCEALELTGVTLVVHDWGGLIGLATLEAIGERVAALVIMNTGLPTGGPWSEEFLKWRRYVEGEPDLPVGKIVSRTLAIPDSMDPAVVAAYDAPFPDRSYKAGARALPLLVPLHSTDAVVPHMRRAREFLSTWNRPALIMFSDRDPYTRGVDALFRRLIPSAQTVVIRNAGHFLQEERGDEVGQHIAAFLSAGS